MKILIRTIPIMILAALMATMAARPAWAQADLAAILRQYYDAVNRGDVAAVMAFFTEDAVARLGNLCSPAVPCVGKAAIQRQIEQTKSFQTRYDVVNIQVSGDTVTARVEQRNLPIQDAGLERVIQKHTVTFRGDKISNIVAELDLSDPQSAAFDNVSRVTTRSTTRRNLALERGDVAGVMATYADDAVFEGWGLCAPAPCVGKGAIQKEIEREVADKMTVANQPRTVRVSGDKMTGTAEIRSDSIKAAGADRVIVSVTAEVKGEKITSLRYVLDLSDAQTAKFAAAQKLPKSGGDASPNEAWLMTLAGLGLLGLGWALRYRLAR